MISCSFIVHKEKKALMLPSTAADSYYAQVPWVSQSPIPDTPSSFCGSLLCPAACPLPSSQAPTQSDSWSAGLLSVQHRFWAAFTIQTQWPKARVGGLSVQKHRHPLWGLNGFIVSNSSRRHSTLPAWPGRPTPPTPLCQPCTAPFPPLLPWRASLFQACLTCHQELETSSVIILQAESRERWCPLLLDTLSVYLSPSHSLLFSLLFILILPLLWSNLIKQI